MDKLLSRTNSYSGKVYALVHKIKDLQSEAMISAGEVKNALKILINHKLWELEKEIHSCYKDSLEVIVNLVDKNAGGSPTAEAFQTLATITSYHSPAMDHFG